MSDRDVYIRACACGHDRASHFHFPGETKKDAYGVEKTTPPGRLTCLCRGCECPAFREVKS